MHIKFTQLHDEQSFQSNYILHCTEIRTGNLLKLTVTNCGNSNVNEESKAKLNTCMLENTAQGLNEGLWDVL